MLQKNVCIEKIILSTFHLWASNVPGETLQKSGKKTQSPHIMRLILRQKNIRAERALQESEKRFRELAELLPETIFEMDLQNRLTFVNNKAFSIAGRTGCLLT